MNQYLYFDKYIKELNALIIGIDLFQKKSQYIAGKITESGTFDSEFYGGTGIESERSDRDVEFGLKGLHFNNPKRVFSYKLWLAANSKDTNYNYSPE